VIDSHTAGEPTRIVISGGPDVGSGSLAERRAIFARDFDRVRSFIVNEPHRSIGLHATRPRGSGAFGSLV
jgi:4-hydroxyproline epimerase